MYKIVYSKPFFDEKEINAVVQALHDGWLGLGKNNDLFEQKLAEKLHKKYALSVNSGSSANLLAVLALNLPKGSEVIVPAATFPTCVSPLYYAGLVPVLIDINLTSLSFNCSDIEQAISPKTRAIFLPHVLGLTSKMSEISDLAKSRGLFLIEDACDALGTTYNNLPCGSFGDISTLSFYASHHITAAGMGGMFLTDNEEFYHRAKSLRDWGRPSDAENKDFNCQIDGIDYDYRYSYPTMGFNLKITELQAAFGLVQLERLDGFIQSRKSNHKYLYENLQKKEFLLPQPVENSDPSWFGFVITINQEKSNFNRKQICNYLEQAGIQTRCLFAGNIKRQPGFKDLNMRISGRLDSSDYVFENTFWIGCHQSLSQNELDFIVETINNFYETTFYNCFDL